MAISLADLLPEKTKDDFRTEIYGELQGRGFVENDGVGFGKVTLSGSPTVDGEVWLKVVSSVGAVVTFKYSTDLGSTWSANVSTNGSGVYTLSAFGVVLTFAGGAVEPKWVANDVYMFEVRKAVFPVSAWQPFSTPRTLVDNNASVLETLWLGMRRIVAGGFLRLARGGWLDLIAQEFYNLERTLGAPAVHDVVLTDGAGQGPFTIAAGTFLVQSDSGRIFRNVDELTLPEDDTVTGSFEAESAGTAYNVPVNSIRTILTPLPGVTANNPGTDGSSLTTQGTDDETDALLQKRCRARWPELGASHGPLGAVYDKWAKEASTQVSRTKSKASESVPGQVDVWIAGPAGALSGGVVDTVQDYLDARAGLCLAPNVASVVNETVTVSGTVYCLTGQLNAAVAAVAANLQVLAQGGKFSEGKPVLAVPIGGIAYRGDIIEAIEEPTSVDHLDIGTFEPVADTSLAENAVFVVSLDLDFVEL